MVTTAILFRSFFFSVGWDFFFFVLACAGIARVCFLRHRVPVIYTYVCNTHQKKDESRPIGGRPQKTRANDYRRRRFAPIRRRLKNTFTPSCAPIYLLYSFSFFGSLIFSFESGLMRIERRPTSSNPPTGSGGWRILEMRFYYYYNCTLFSRYIFLLC